MEYEISVFVGSLRKASINRQLAGALEQLLPANMRFSYMDLGALPLYNQDLDDNMPASVLAMKAAVQRAHGLIFVTPEHNRSIPAALKNAIDWGSRPPGHNVWQDKPAGMLGATYGPLGTALAQQHLQYVLEAEGAPVLTAPRVFLQFKDGLIDASGTITQADTRALLQKWVNNYVAWVHQLSGWRTTPPAPAK